MASQASFDDEWRHVRLDFVGAIVTGGTPPTRDRSNYGFHRMFVGPGDLGRAKYVTRTAKMLSERGFARSRRVPAGSTLFVCIGSTIGKVGLAAAELATNQQINAIVPNRQVDPEYLYYAATTLSALVRDRAGEQAVPLVNKSDFSAFEIPLPRMEEQRRIAATLQGAERLVTALEALIAKKHAIRAGIIQELLTGRRRLPGFTEAWRRVEVRELLEFRNGLNKESSFFGSGTPIVNFMDVMNGPVIAAGDVTGRVTLTRDEIKRFSAKKGDLFFTRTSETVDEVGTAAALVEHVSDAVFSGFVLRGRPRVRDLDSQFLAHLFKTEVIRQQVTSTASYTTRALTNGRALGRVVVDIPTLKEQRAISQVLGEVDAEIGALRARLTKAEAVKRGMKQELLTGRKRLPMEGEAAV
ncbi:restriction endonuclease subunit S [Streptomyces albidoflavus]